MNRDDAIRELMGKLMQAVETSISASAAVREALAELVRNGYEARLFFVANAESAEKDEEAPDAEAGATPEFGAVPNGGELRFELSKLDRDFLKSLHIRPEGS